MKRRKAVFSYLTGTLGQIVLVSIVVWLLRSKGMKIDATTLIGILAIGVGGISSALWGSIVTIKYKNICNYSGPRFEFN